jgi:hypothetical protein
VTTLAHYLFYQHNVQKFFIRHIDKYDGILVPFSIAASFPSGTYGFLRALLAKDRTKHFALDPRSALFQHRWKRANVRDPHRKAAAIFGEPFTTRGLTTCLEAKDFDSAERIGAITEACISYQKGFRVLQEEKRKLDKYRKLLGIDTIPEIQNPQRYIPPYFQIEDENDPWMEISLACIEHSAKLIPAAELTPIFHFSEWSKFDAWETVAGRFKASDITSFFLYPNNFREHEAKQDDLKAYVHAVALATEQGLACLALHGGYFAIMLEKRGLAGFGNGVGYGEWRDSGYHRGGTAEVRIYIPKLHRFIDPPAAQSLLEKDPDYFSADSDLLAECVAANKPLTAILPAEALDHFMECRDQEIHFVRENSEAVIVAELRETVSRLQKIGQLEVEKFGASLARWADTLVPVAVPAETQIGLPH